jgi:hypothetical protein
VVGIVSHLTECLPYSFSSKAVFIETNILVKRALIRNLHAEIFVADILGEGNKMKIY